MEARKGSGLGDFWEGSSSETISLAKKGGVRFQISQSPDLRSRTSLFRGSFEGWKSGEKIRAHPGSTGAFCRRKRHLGGKSTYVKGSFVERSKGGALMSVI